MCDSNWIACLLCRLHRLLLSAFRAGLRMSRHWLHRLLCTLAADRLYRRAGMHVNTFCTHTHTHTCHICISTSCHLVSFQSSWKEGSVVYAYLKCVTTTRRWRTKITRLLIASSFWLLFCGLIDDQLIGSFFLTGRQTTFGYALGRAQPPIRWLLGSLYSGDDGLVAAVTILLSPFPV